MNFNVCKWGVFREDTNHGGGSYANQVSGEVKAVIGKNLRQGNVWENIELPRLKSNPNVTKITTIDPETMIETTIFTR